MTKKRKAPPAKRENVSAKHDADEGELADDDPSAEALVGDVSAEAEELTATDDDLDRVEREGADDDAAAALQNARDHESAALVSSRRSIAVTDPLQAYINEARRYPLLTREEEHDLAVRYVEEGDVAAAREMVTANLRLVVKIAHEYRRAYRNLLDLVQEGNIGLMHAVKKFDPYRGVKLSTYAAWWIRAYILKFILNNWRMVKIGTTQSQRKLFFNLRKEVEKLRRLGVDNPEEPKLLAERLDVPEHEVVTMQSRMGSHDVSLDAPLRSEEGSSSRMDFVADGGPRPDEDVADIQFSERVQAVIRAFGQTLSGREREIFELRTVADEPLTLQEIGQKYGITRERSRQLERRMMDRLRDHLRDQLGDAVDIHLGITD